MQTINISRGNLVLNNETKIFVSLQIAEQLFLPGGEAAADPDDIVSALPQIVEEQ